jgi:hypothetical protein
MGSPPSLKQGEGSKGSPYFPAAREGKDLYDGYVAYFGTFTVDEKNHVVIHHVEASLHPGYTGTDQKRPFTLSGDNLMLGDGKYWRRTFVRVK